MRNERTVDEQRAIDSVKQFCSTRGLSLGEDHDITDRPDALLIMPGKRIACECRILTPEKVLRMHGIALREGEPYRAFVPAEPHMWVRKAIDAKSPKAADYKTRTNADEVWLILHGKAGFLQDIVDQVLLAHFEFASMGAHQILHPFDHIFIVLSDGNVACIYSSSESEIKREKFKSWRIIQFPVRILSVSVVTATSGENGQGVLSVNLNSPHRLIKCQPLDQDFFVDYSSAHELDFANINDHNPGPQLVAIRKPEKVIPVASIVRYLPNPP